jgi:hypothetical protein
LGSANAIKTDRGPALGSKFVNVAIAHPFAETLRRSLVQAAPPQDGKCR